MDVSRAHVQPSGDGRWRRSSKANVTEGCRDGTLNGCASRCLVTPGTGERRACYEEGEEAGASGAKGCDY